MGKIRNIVPIALAAGFVFIGAAQADSYDTVNPDGSVTRTNLTPQGETKSVTTLSPPKRQTQADINQRMAEAAAYRGTGRVDNSGIVTTGRVVSGYTYPYPYYSAPGGVTYYQYPSYPYSYQLPGHNGSGAWITSIPSNSGGYYSYPGYNCPPPGGYPVYNGYPVNNGYPFNYNYPAYGYPTAGYPAYNYPSAAYPPYQYGYGTYGNGSFSGSTTSTYGGVILGRGGLNVTIGGRNSTTTQSYSNR